MGRLRGDLERLKPRLRDELLDVAILGTLPERQVLVERW